jgi:hypothetical protein
MFPSNQQNYASRCCLYINPIPAGHAFQTTSSNFVASFPKIMAAKTSSARSKAIFIFLDQNLQRRFCRDALFLPACVHKVSSISKLPWPQAQSMENQLYLKNFLRLLTYIVNERAAQKADDAPSRTHNTNRVAAAVLRIYTKSLEMARGAFCMCFTAATRRRILLIILFPNI